MRRFGPLGLAIIPTLAVALVGVGAAGPPANALVPAQAPIGPVAALTEPGVVHFTAAGDYGSTANTRAVLQAMAGAGADLNLALGDLSYGTTGQEQAWCDMVTGYLGTDFPFELLSGNHESNGLNGNIDDFAACLPNKLPGLVGTYGRQWYVDVPQQDPLVRFVMISPTLNFPDEGTYGYAPGSPRYTWTTAAIDGARAAGVPWVVVGIHKPCLSMGQYSCELGQGLHDMLLAKKVDLVLNGHEHLYQRSKQLGLGPACPGVVPNTFDPDCIVDADATMVKGAGTVLATVGTGGVPLRAVQTADPEAGYFAASSGLATPSYGALDVRVTATSLTAGFLRASGTFTDAFTISAGAPAPNVPPSAAAAATCTGLVCRFDGSASTDVDGTVVSYEWSFGDDTTGTGATVTHEYATEGTFTASVTVTDDDGATATTSRDVTVAPAGPVEPLAEDTFTRTTSAGFGPAETGGTWRTGGDPAQYAVTDGAGRITLAAPRSGPHVSLRDLSSSGTDVSLSVSPDKVPDGGGLYVSVSARRVPVVGEYRAKLQLRSNGTVGLSLGRVTAGIETPLTSAVVPRGVTYAAGDQLRIRTSVTGTVPTQVSAKVWRAGTPEPDGWQVSATDLTPGLQLRGGIGVSLYLSSTATNAPIQIALDDLLATTS